VSAQIATVSPGSANALAEDSRLHRAYLLRAVEERLLRLFSEGRVSGTTHTCIGQELSAVVLAESLDRTRDLIFSNHRCHGHYVAWTDDVDGLIAEVMGKASGICGGIGGSQHLCGDRFFSNGIQGGIVPVSAGLALAQKLAGSGGVVAVCIGDGTLGEGALYESLNIAAKWRLPLLVLLENNLYAQSTSQSETLAGDICARAAAFGIQTFQGTTWEHEMLAQEMRAAVRLVRDECVPAFIRVDTYRLMAHSKGDDNRDPQEIAAYAKRDPLNQFLAQSQVAGDRRFDTVRERIELAVERAAQQPPLKLRLGEAGKPSLGTRPVTPRGGTQLEEINRALADWMAADPAVILLGEDIRSPYGGAFKATRGLSDAYPDRVINAPISEAAIAGIGNGLGLGGRRPVVEIMFGDFLGLCFDQIVNHAAKFRGMYNQQVCNPLVIRTPMGGGRGYGPTHSQNLEKHFAGIPGMTVLALHGRARISEAYASLREITDPVLMIENKLLYRERGDAPVPPGYELHETIEAFPATLLRPPSTPDITVVAFGRMSVLAERAAARLFADEEIALELVFPLQISPLNIEPVLQSVARTGKLLVIEEGTPGFDLGSEVIAAASVGYRGSQRLHVRRIAAQPVPIPSAVDLEQLVLPSEAGVVAACVSLFDE
jgi:2-oxoisovalerate dehydrogenase E1 component